jgi:predicted Zn finger-like uncharacterized protein
MQLSTVTCPECATTFVVDTGLFDIGTVRLRCTTCAHYFLPEASPRSRTVENVCKLYNLPFDYERYRPAPGQ